MPTPVHLHPSSGFTLLELALVLMAMALIMAGILTWQT
jgi:prepilin-type N-terminal cleavage/methylation domain-containing protein